MPMNCTITRIGKSTPFAICSYGRPWRLSTRAEKTSKQPVRAAAAALPGVEGVTVHLTAMTDEERKAVHMAQLIGVPIAGVVENMAYFKCPDTGRQHPIFGPSHADEVTEAAHAPLLARLPINPLVTALCDAGRIEAVTLPETTGLLESFLDVLPVGSGTNST
ncbi:MAG: P-loop NTPase [Anaerolineales bacterium]|nr:P-loop NTPase [Anaerolineales bacterium]